MSGKKGIGHRIWSKEEKLKCVHKYLDEHISIKEIGKESGISSSTISAWIKKYLEKGEKGLAGKILFYSVRL